MRIFAIPPKKKISVNILLIAINAAAFILFSILIQLKVISLDYIALKPSNILQGKYLWTFFTSMFMHAGLFHIFANMLSLIFTGSLVERLIGRKRYLYFYILSGLFAGVFFVALSYFFPLDFNSYAVGASGALFGLVGLLMLLTPNLSVYIMFIPIPIKMKYAAPAMLVMLWLVSIFGDIPIGNTAHLGGFVFGLIFAIYLKNRYKKKTEYIRKYFS